MKVAVIGTGYVGLVLGACLADTGNDVICADLDEAKIAGLKANVLPIFEPGLDVIVERNQRSARLTFTTDVATAVRFAQFVFIAVGTPADEDGSADLSYVLAAAKTIAENAQQEVVVVTKSTVPVGTAERIRDVLAQHAHVPFHVCSNPEFLKEGAAVDDFTHPDRVIVGTDSQRARELMEELYEPYVRSGKPLIFMDLASAELTKYAANAMLATRISFMNEMAVMCERAGANVDLVRLGIGSDPRIGPSFLLPGPGFGGSCFPKDVRALLRTADDHDVELRVLSGVHAANERQKARAADKLRALVGGSLQGKRIAVWGLAFKAQTDDMRESPALVLIAAVRAEGGIIVAHDPESRREAERRLGDQIELVDSAYAACDGADALVLMTDWNEYRSPDWARVRQALRAPVVVDMRNLYSPARMRGLGFAYDSVGRPA
jgi:UDPglucose 6-dehydrogenase